jgi:hypothetical protein
MASPGPVVSGRIQLPRSAPRSRQHTAWVKVLTRIKESLGLGAQFEGRLFAPGAVVGRDELGVYAVVLEFAGPAGRPGHGHTRTEQLWILWQYDSKRDQWRELAQATAVGAEWAEVLLPAARAALYPSPEVYDVIVRSRTAAEAIMDLVMGCLEREPAPVKVQALAAVYNQVAGRIAELG